LLISADDKKASARTFGAHSSRCVLCTAFDVPLACNGIAIVNNEHKRALHLRGNGMKQLRGKEVQ
jgi:hypothetical protein